MKSILKIILVAAVLSTAIGAIVQSLPVGLTIFVVLLILVNFPIYVKYAKDNPDRLWFKRKLFGWGWTPVTWQGWAVISGYVALVMLLALTIDDTSPPREVAFMFILPMIILTALLIRICYLKGEKPKWQWGKDLEKYM
jgi:uncharacterized membrane protein YhaH (DUF805 family)